MRFGEDIDFSIRIYESGARCGLIPQAWVWHKRRTDLRKFFKQVHNSGIARINLMKRHPGSLKLVHLLPAVFTLGVVAMLTLTVAGLPWCVYSLWCLMPLVLYCGLIFADSSIANRSARVGLLSVPAAFVQLMGYGTGFIRAWFLRCVCGRNEELQAFKENFYE